MLKFVKHNLEGINGVEIYPIISLVIFFIIFISYLVYALSYSKEQVKIMSELPFKEK
ncbi:CcoQ/FixQ family Cbb3-type cytochrome c oxidase assembly chaperone [Flavobacterium sp.]|jgi:cbb3-type cytochrome oxidase subunit 3|uniref:CcoQ/FixQ family Cbb3-type cytochrome c oxidase assembly chaperone n=1 Tax=Flavobacterium sp. TaxID=239 RepID=UPI0037BF6069